MDHNERLTEIWKNLRKRKVNNCEEDLVIAITQDFKSKEILMVAFMNEEAFRKTLETGIMHYFSTSRKKLWKKGETSGNIQKVKEIYLDCDGDALLFRVEQVGGACHDGYFSCFYRKLDLESYGLVISGERF